MSKKKEVKNQCKDAVEELIDSGLLEAISIDTDGNFCYKLTPAGEIEEAREVNKKIEVT